jgi:hypothetical protein
MSFSYFKKERGGVNPAGWEQPVIYKDPPKGIFTRKYEPVNVADTMYMLQADNQYGDPTRYNEAIQVYARGQNPMVEVSYQNAGGASTNSSLGNAQVSNPYKVEVVRPPLMPAEVLVPLSAPRIHQNYSVTTNPGIYPQSIAGEYDKSKVRLMTTNYTNNTGQVVASLNRNIQVQQERSANQFAKQLAQVLPIAVAPSHAYHIDTMRDQSVKYVSETKDALAVASVAPISFTDIVVYDPKTNSNIMVQANIKEKNAVAVTAAASAPLKLHTNDGQTIRLKDYDYKVVVAPAGNTQMVITVRQPDVKLERNTPLYAAASTISGGNFSSDFQRQIAREISLESVLPLISATSAVQLRDYNEQALRNSYDPNKMQLDLNSPMVSATASVKLSNQGYNEENWRQGKWRELNKQATFGAWTDDRVSKTANNIRGMVW